MRKGRKRWKKKDALEGRQKNLYRCPRRRCAGNTSPSYERAAHTHVRPIIAKLGISLKILAIPKYYDTEFVLEILGMFVSLSRLPSPSVQVFRQARASVISIPSHKYW